MHYCYKLASIATNMDAHSAISIFTLGAHEKMLQTTNPLTKNLLVSVGSLKLSKQRTNRNCTNKTRKTTQVMLDQFKESKQQVRRSICYARTRRQQCKQPT